MNNNHLIIIFFPFFEVYHAISSLFLASAYVLGEPLWVQEDQGGDNFLLQFDSSFVDVNLGDSGVISMFKNDAFWQCS